ncbi:L-rhamnose mutarotase [Zhouia sp. PK063]|uniref:L-rhamnose mutarotase n=1 Tax=Zhouia sp. PK063 TaxID=3373602 RepID=UPI0037BBB48B
MSEHRYVLTLKLKNDPNLITSYKKYHEEVWPEVLDNFKLCDINSIEIYLLDTLLVMVMIVGPNFSFERKVALEKENKVVQKWEKLMSTYQETPTSGDKWKIMDSIFKF